MLLAVSSRPALPLYSSVMGCWVDELAIIGQARHVRALPRVRSRFPRGRDTRTTEIAKPASEGGSAYPAGAGKTRCVATPSFPYLADFSKPFGVHRQSAPKISRFRAGCAATPEAAFACFYARRIAHQPRP